MIRCSICGEAAVISREDGRNNLCRDHFIEDVERRVKETVSRRGMIAEGDRIAVALSGGKDSTALLYTLRHILEGRRDVQMIAVTVDEGIKSYRDDTVQSARRSAGDIGIEHVVVSFEDEFGLDLDGMVATRRAGPCTICGVLRKNLLNRTARAVGATKLAVGHNLDDQSQSVLMNYLKADIERLARLEPRRVQGGLIPRIKPLQEIPEREVALYTILKGVYVETAECPYAVQSFRADVRDMLNKLEDGFPGTKASIVDGFHKLSVPLEGRYPQANLSQCSLCGEPCIGSVCKACELMGKIESA